MKNKKIVFILLFIVFIVFIGLWMYFNTGLKRFEKEVSDLVLPEMLKELQ